VVNQIASAHEHSGDEHSGCSAHEHSEDEHSGCSEHEHSEDEDSECSEHERSEDARLKRRIRRLKRQAREQKLSHESELKAVNDLRFLQRQQFARSLVEDGEIRTPAGAHRRLTVLRNELMDLDLDVLVHAYAMDLRGALVVTQPSEQETRRLHWREERIATDAAASADVAVADAAGGSASATDEAAADAESADGEVGAVGADAIADAADATVTAASTATADDGGATPGDSSVGERGDAGTGRSDLNGGIRSPAGAVAGEVGATDVNADVVVGQQQVVGERAIWR